MIGRRACFSGLVQSLGLGSSSLSLSKFEAYSCRASGAASSLQEACKPLSYRAFGVDEYADVDWDNLGFGIMPTDYMYSAKCSEDRNLEHEKLSHYGNIELSPSAGVLNYGQGLFEGTKAYRKEDGQLLLYRPDQNAIRMRIGAERMCMPCPSVDQFVDAVKRTVLANKRSPSWKRCFSSGPVLGLAPATEYTFLIYASPVGNYFKKGIRALNLYVEEEYNRACRGGTGGVKAIGNYAPALKASTRAKSRGFSEVLYLDSVDSKFLEEASSSNIFIVKGDVISTPAINGTILPGVTRKSIIDIALDSGYKVEERAISVDELMNADEVFCTGTAVVVAPVGSINYKDKRIEYKTGAGCVSREMYSTLVGIQTGLIGDKKGWTIEIP